MVTLSTVDTAQIPLIDISPLASGAGLDTVARHAVARQIRQACRDTGFFYIVVKPQTLSLNELTPIPNPFSQKRKQGVSRKNLMETPLM